MTSDEVSEKLEAVRRELVEKCPHTSVMPTFDEEEAKKVLGEWEAKSALEFVTGNPASQEIRRRWPRFHGTCPDCKGKLVLYASWAHYAMGDW